MQTKSVFNGVVEIKPPYVVPSLSLRNNLGLFFVFLHKTSLSKWCSIISCLENLQAICLKMPKKQNTKFTSAEFQRNISRYIISRINPIALRKAKIVFNFGLSECNRVKRQESKQCRFRCCCCCIVVLRPR